MRYDAIEAAVLAILEPMIDASNAPLFDRGFPKKFEGEFGGTFQIPEDFNPNRKYAMVQASGSQYTGQNKQNLSVVGLLHVFVGSQADTRGKAKQDVYERLDAVQSALHGRDLTDAKGLYICTTRLFQDAQEFTLANHVCWSASFHLLTTLNINV